MVPFKLTHYFEYLRSLSRHRIFWKCLPSDEARAGDLCDSGSG